MDLLVLKNELDIDPETRGYSGMSDSEAAADLNIEYESRNKTSISGSEAFEQTDTTEYEALTDTKRSEWLSLCGIDSHDPFGAVAAVVVDIFGVASATVTNLQAARVESVTRGVKLGIGTVTTGDVEKARAIV